MMVRANTIEGRALHAYFVQGRRIKAIAVAARITMLEREAHEAYERLPRLYNATEEGIAEMDGLLRDRITALKADRDRIHGALA